MEQIGSDIQNLISKNLSGQDMVRLCSASSKLRKQCSSMGMRFYWKDQINKDFGIDYNDADTYQEYLRLSWLGGQKLYVVHIYDKSYGQYSDNTILGVYLSYDLAVDAVEKYMYNTDYDEKYITEISEHLKEGKNIPEGFFEVFEIKEFYPNKDRYNSIR